MLSPLFTYLLLSAVTYRFARFILKDTLIEGLRHEVLKRISGKPRFGPIGQLLPQRLWRAKLVELLQCWWCFSIWAGAIVMLVAWHWVSIPLPGLYWIALSTGALVFTDVIKGS